MTLPTPLVPGRFTSPRHPVPRLFALLTVLSLAAGTILLTAAPAQAAVRHLGFSGGSGTGSGWLGDVETSTGSDVFAYCVDPYGLFPAGDTGGTGLVTSIPGTTAAANPGHNGTQNVSGHDIEKLNYALWNWGDAKTAVQAAAMDAYVYTLSSSDHTGTGVDYFVDIRVPAAERAAVKARYRAIASDTDAHWNDAASLSAKTTITITDAAAGRGYVDVAITPSSARGTLTLANATQDGTGATSVSVTDGARIQLDGAPTPTHNYTMKADLVVTGPYDYAKNVHLYTTPSNDEYQRVIRHGERSATHASAHAESAPISVEFSPVVATSVTSELVSPGQSFIDHVTSYSANGTWTPGTSIVGDYTIYGPLADQPTPAASVPADAPVAATGSATFAGPVAVDVSSSSPAAASGWYAWVWTVRADRQDAAVQGVLPANYSWTSVFADPAESSAVPISIDLTTDTAQKTVGLYSSVTDSVTVSHDPGTGAWWTSGGAPVVVGLDGTAFWVPGDTAPVPSDSPPAGATSLGTASLEVSAAGTYPSPAVSVPASTAGFVVWQWTVRTDPRVLPHTELWGEASQITRVVAPTLTTTAGTDVAPGAQVSDLAHVAGPAPAQPISLVFEAYKQSTDAAICSPDNRVVDTHANPISVSAAGDYESPAAVFDTTGTYRWIASLLAPDGSVIATGACDDPVEATAVLPFTVTTNASPTQPLGAPATDVATVAGPTPQGASLVFRVYRLDDAAQPTCTGANLVSTSTPIALAGAGDYTSEPVTFDRAATYAWVETAYDAAGVEISSGECGQKSELTTIRAVVASATVSAHPKPSATSTVDSPRGPKAPAPPELAHTGSAIDPALIGAVAAGLLIAAAILFSIARRRSRVARK